MAGCRLAIQRKCVRTSGSYSVGNAARTYGDIRGFPYRNEDFALAKQFSISEHKHLEIRCDVLNAFNRSIWNNPNTSVTDPSRIQGGRAIGFGSVLGTLECRTAITASSQVHVLTIAELGNQENAWHRAQGGHTGPPLRSF
jgi:hypothetical protein